MSASDPTPARPGDRGGERTSASAPRGGPEGTVDRAQLRLWLRLLGSATIIEQQLKTRLREEFDVTLAQFDLMAEIARGDAPKTMSEISELLMVSNGNVTGVVDRLSRDGLVKRTPSPDDRRAYLLSLTPAGRELFERMAARHARWLAALLADLEPAFVARLGDDMKVLRDAVRAAARARDAGEAPA